MFSTKIIARIAMKIVLIAIAVIVNFVGYNQITTATHAVGVNVLPGNPNIKYIGRWDISSSTVHTSYWPGAYLETKFTGTAVKIKLARSVNICVSIDHGFYTLYASAKGMVNLTPKPLATGTHSLMVAAYTEHDVIRFEGLVLDPGAQTVAPTVSSKLIEFVGDSITSGTLTSEHALSDYAWLIGERLSVEHTQIAQGGISLTNKPSGVGMATQYFKMQTVYFPNSPDWNFSRYRANVVVINLGTNDAGISNAMFQSTDISFLQKIRQKYPHAHIFVLRTFRGTKANPIKSAANAVIAAGDHNVQYIDTTDWISASDTVDRVHPTDAGHVKIANQLGPIIASALGMSWSPIIKSSRKQPDLQ